MNVSQLLGITSLCLGVSSLWAESKAASVIYVANVENQTKPNVHYTGLPWKTLTEGYLEGIGPRSQLWGLPAPEAGDFRIEAELKLPRQGKTSLFLLGASSRIALTSGGSSLSLHGRFFQVGEAPVNVAVPVTPPHETLRLIVRRQAAQVTVSYAGKEVYRGPCSQNALDHVGFNAHEGAVQLYEFRAEGMLSTHATLKPFSNAFGMQLRRPPAKAAEIRTPVIVGEPPSQECSAITRRDGTLEIYFITKPDSRSVSLIRSKDGGLTWSAPQQVFALEGTAHYGIQALEDQKGDVQIVFHLFGQGQGGYKGRLYEVYHTRSQSDGSWTKPQRVIPGYVGAIRGFMQLKSGRLLVGVGLAVPEREDAPKSGPDLGWHDTVVYYSDDAVTWHRSPDNLQVELNGPNNTRYGAIEPVMVELGDGRVSMLIRDRCGRLYESFSRDGSRWSKAERSRFISSDSPAALLRLRDGRILILWNACQNWADPRSYAMGGREVLHAAISADQGKTWSGFREVLHETNRVSGGDRGTAYPSPTETADGKILVVSGQGEGKRAMFLFDPAWLLEKKVSGDDANSVPAWTQFGDEGLAQQDAAGSDRCLAIPMKSSGLCGAGFNFPAWPRGTLSFRIWVPSEAKEAALGLNDHFNRVDDAQAAEHQVFRAALTNLPRDTWQDIQLEWDTSGPEGKISLKLGDAPAKVSAPLRDPVSPLSYLRLEARSDKNTGALKLANIIATESTPQ